MFVTTMGTARISDLRRGHLWAEFVPKLPVGSFHRSDSEGCTIVTIERHSSDRLSAGPLYIPLQAHRPRLKFWRTIGEEKLKLSQKIQQYNGTTVVDFGERVQNPSKITSRTETDDSPQDRSLGQQRISGLAGSPSRRSCPAG